MKDSTAVKNINMQLKFKFGMLFDGRPNFRIVWSNDQREYRQGEFNDFIPGTNILLRRFKGIREVDKYPFKSNRWVLERLVYMFNPEIVSSENGTYEPVFIFEDKGGFFLEPIWRAVELMVHTLLYGSPLPRKSDQDYTED